MVFPLLGFACYLAPVAAVLLALDRMKERGRRHKIAAICAGIAVFLPPAFMLQSDRTLGFWALMALLAGSFLCFAWRPFKNDLRGGRALRLLSLFSCAVYLIFFCEMGGVDIKR